jgi:hypothetical protein
MTHFVDSLDPRVFWPALVVIWFSVSVVILMAVGKIIRWGDTE